MKKSVLIIAIITCLIMVSTMLIACNEKEVKYFTITFDSNGGSEVSSLTLEEGASIALPSNPTKEGYIFAGWYIDSSLLESFNEEEIQLIDNITLYVKWEIDQSACEHSYSDWQILLEPNCIDEGLKARTCITCSFVQEEDISALGHDFSDEWSIDLAPTCEASGSKSHHCSRCDEIVDVTDIDALGHEYEYHEAQGQTSTCAGWGAYKTCANCDFTTFKEYSVGLEYVLSDDYMYVIVDGMGECDSIDINIPHEVDGIPVKEIGKDAFYMHKTITSIIIPDSVTSIGTQALCACHSLTSITLGTGVENISTSAFNNCLKLVEIVNLSSLDISIENDNVYGASYVKQVITSPDDSKLVREGEYIIYEDGEERILISYIGSDRDLILPDTITSIYQYMFNLYPIRSVVIPDSLTSIGTSAFALCNSLESVILGNGIVNIGDYAFIGCGSLTSITIPDSVTKINVGAFSRCERLVEVVNHSSLDITIGDYNSNGGVGYYAKQVITSSEDSKLVTEGDYIIYEDGNERILVSYTGDDTDLVLPNTITAINQYALFNLSITSVVIQEGVTSIGDNALSWCYSLTNITIPSSVTSIGDDAFYQSYLLSQITFNGTVEEWNVIEKGDSWDYSYHSKGYTVYCTDGNIYN